MEEKARAHHVVVVTRGVTEMEMAGRLAQAVGPQVWETTGLTDAGP